MNIVRYLMFLVLGMLLGLLLSTLFSSLTTWFWGEADRHHSLMLLSFRHWLRSCPQINPHSARSDAMA